MRATILGSGSSGGVPVVGIGWGACDPGNPKNRRMRPSILIESGDTTVLVDTSPDLRQQLLDANVRRLDAVVYTHSHADHLHGIDDLRGINRAMNAPINAYGDANTLKHIADRFGYTLTPLPGDNVTYFKPTLNVHEIMAGNSFDINCLTVDVFDQDHGYSRTLGLRFGPIGYSTDLVEMTNQGYDALAGVDTWIVGVFTDKPHKTHVHLAKALKWIERLKPRRAVLTHLGPDLDYEEVLKLVPDGVEAAFDGMVVEAENGG
ncbi:MAG: MBL fold metallo-hydrolase [Rhodospirillales bacterium]